MNRKLAPRRVYNDRSANVIGPDSQSVFKWAGMAALATQLIGGGLAKAQAVLDTPLLTAASSVAGVAVTIPDPARGIQLLARGNLDVFMDMYPQMLAYQSGGIAAIQAMFQAGQIKDAQYKAWSLIDQGQQMGNQQL